MSLLQQCIHTEPKFHFQFDAHRGIFKSKLLGLKPGRTLLTMVMDIAPFIVLFTKKFSFLRTSFIRSAFLSIFHSYYMPSTTSVSQELLTVCI